MQLTCREGLATAQVVCDSINQDGSRLTSLEVTFPRPYLAEFNTHRVFERNSASSRAIPVWKRLAAVLEDPYVPLSFGANRPGMQSSEALAERDMELAQYNWLSGRDLAVLQCYALAGGAKEILREAKDSEEAHKLVERILELQKEYGSRNPFQEVSRSVHKQHANRPLEPYSYHLVLVSSTEWRNFFGLRASGNAQPEAQDFALAMARAMMQSTPTLLHRGDWHLPYIMPIDKMDCKDPVELAYASAGKCARTSYLTHDGKRALEKDVELAKSLCANGHMSPFGHVARPLSLGEDANPSNFHKSWMQLRKLITNEQDFSHRVTPEELLVGCRGDEAMVEFILGLAS